jgi:hypothetical protein
VKEPVVVLLINIIIVVLISLQTHDIVIDSFTFMCEFCSFASGNSSNRDAFHSDFSGFFSSDAIEAAVRQANRTKHENRKNGSGSGGVGDDQDDGEGGVDDDGT